MTFYEPGLAETQVTVSIVSHGHGFLVEELLNDLGGYSSKEIDVILTINVEEDLPFEENDYDFPLTIVKNDRPRGFGANHNAAFGLRHGEYFCVLNPDIRLDADPFGPLLPYLAAPGVGITAPLVRSATGSIEDSARRLPTPLTIIGKIFDRRPKPDYPIGTIPFNPDWVAGMFMLFRSETYARMGGFDERYFLYYEDVDLCARMTLAGYTIVLDPQISVIHDARRESHRNFAYFRWHAASIVRFFLSPVFFRHMLRRVWSRKETSF
ncbi:MAG: glycosyltransferase family protein [Acidiferrobacterales bacterium]